jgi:hypothetical protein
MEPPPFAWPAPAAIMSSGIVSARVVHAATSAEKEAKSRKAESSMQPHVAVLFQHLFQGMPYANKISDQLLSQGKVPSLYMYFCKEVRPKIVTESPQFSFGEVGQALIAAWEKLNDDQKAKVSVSESVFVVSGMESACAAGVVYDGYSAS